MEQVVSTYLNYLNIPVSKSYSEKSIASHPDYPSLLCIADTLDQLGINHKVVRVEKKEWNKIPLPCLFQFDQGELKLIKSEDDFPAVKKRNANAIIIKAELTEEILNQESNRRYSKELLLKKVGAIGVGATVGVLLILFFKLISWMHALLLCSSLVGSFVGYLLIAKEIGITYDAVEEFCDMGSKAGCDELLRSKSAKLYGNISLADLAASYFLFQTFIVGIVVPLSKVASSYYAIVSLFAVLTVPVIIYSLYYQIIKTKIICRLCLFVNIVLVSQLAILIYGNWIPSYNEIDLFPLVLSILALSAIGSGVILLKDLINGLNKSTKKEVLANRIKYDPKIFSHLLNREKQVDISSLEREITIGDPNAPLSLHFAATLGCAPCKEAYFKSLELITLYPRKIRLNIRFRFLRTDEYNPRPPLGDESLYLMWYWNRYIYGKKNESELTKNFFNDWYKTMNIEEFINQYPECSDYDNSSEIRDLAAQHTIWFERSGILTTPHFFINGFEMPHNYEITDLIPLMHELKYFPESNLIGATN